MNENEQIQEMANDLAQHCPDLVENCCGASSCVSCITRFLFNAGYRKVERGEWKKTCVPDVYQCTNCKRPTKMDMLCDSEVLRAFCPNCGADMRGEGDE